MRRWTLIHCVAQVLVLPKADDVRVVAPLMMEESLVPIVAPEPASSTEQSLCYKVTGGGLLEPGKPTSLPVCIVCAVETPVLVWEYGRRKVGRTVPGILMKCT